MKLSETRASTTFVMVMVGNWMSSVLMSMLQD